MMEYPMAPRISPLVCSLKYTLDQAIGTASGRRYTYLISTNEINKKIEEQKMNMWPLILYLQEVIATNPRDIR